MDWLDNPEEDIYSSQDGIPIPLEERNLDEKVKEIRERNEAKSFNLYPNHIDPNLMKVIYEDVNFLLKLLKKKEKERERLSKLLIEARMRIVELEREKKRIGELEEGIELHHERTTLSNQGFHHDWEDEELYNLIPKKE